MPIDINFFYRAVQRNPNNLEEFQEQSDTEKSSLISQVIEKLSLDDLSKLNVQYRAGKTKYNPLQNLLDFLNNNLDKENIETQKSKLNEIILKIIIKISFEPKAREYLYQIKACFNLLKKTEISINSNLDIFLELGKFELRLIKSHDLIDLLPHNLKDRECFEELINDYLTFVKKIDYRINSKEVRLIVDQLREFKILTQFRDVNPMDQEISEFFKKIQKKIEEIGELESKFPPGFQSDAFNPISRNNITNNADLFNSNVHFPISNISSPSLLEITNGTSANNFLSNNAAYIGSGLGGLVLLAITGIAFWWRNKITKSDQTDEEANKNMEMPMKNLPPVSELKTTPKKTYHYITEKTLEEIRDYSNNLQTSLKNFVNSLKNSISNDCSIIAQNLNDQAIEKNYLERIGNKQFVLDTLIQSIGYTKIFELHELLMEDRHKEAYEKYDNKELFKEKMATTANIFKLMQGFYETDPDQNNTLKPLLAYLRGLMQGRAMFDSSILDSLETVMRLLNSLLSSIRQPLGTYNTMHAGLEGEIKGEKNGKQQILNSIHKLETHSKTFFAHPPHNTVRHSMPDRPSSSGSDTSDMSGMSGQSIYNSSEVQLRTKLIQNKR
jgi:hypothetical protein